MPLTLEMEQSQGAQSYYQEIVEISSFVSSPLSNPDNSSWLVDFCPDVPPDFFEALSDFNAGRVVDLDTALNESPPEE